MLCSGARACALSDIFPRSISLWVSRGFPLQVYIEVPEGIPLNIQEDHAKAEVRIVVASAYKTEGSPPVRIRTNTSKGVVVTGAVAMSEVRLVPFSSNVIVYKDGEEKAGSNYITPNVCFTHASTKYKTSIATPKLVVEDTRGPFGSAASNGAALFFAPPFWLVATTRDKLEANMALSSVKVELRVGSKASTVVVTIMRNTRALEVGEELFFYKPIAGQGRKGRGIMAGPRLQEQGRKGRGKL